MERVAKNLLDKKKANYGIEVSVSISPYFSTLPLECQMWLGGFVEVDV